MWKKPQRPTAAVTQPYSDGMVQICRTVDEAEPGQAPRPALRHKVRLPYGERRMGIRRYYEAKAAQALTERVIRVPDPGNVQIREGVKVTDGGINTQDVAVTEDGRRYGIEMVQLAEGVFPRSLDLTLRRIDPRYETVEILGGTEA